MTYDILYYIIKKKWKCVISLPFRIANIKNTDLKKHVFCQFRRKMPGPFKDRKYKKY